MKSFSDYIINTKVLKQGAINIKTLIGSNIKLCAVVKANAYGLGVETVCKTLFGIADFFAVSNVSEGLGIRVFDKSTKIVVLGMTSLENLGICSQNDISISVSNLQMCNKILEYCSQNKVYLNVHIQVNSGLNRYGFRKIAEFIKAIKLIDKSEYVSVEGVYSHFATKQNDVEFIKKQFMRFNQFKKYVQSKKVVFHIANSFATTNNRIFKLNMVRNGFLIYGGTKNNIENKFVLEIKSKLVNIFEVKKGDTIGYDRTYLVKSNMKIGVVPLGYADGMDRRLSNNFSVLICGKKCPIVGLICMDVFMVDLTGVDCELYSEVVLLGQQKQNSISIDDYAKVMNTSPYEVLLGFNYRRMNYVIKK